jgi:hypothetical protein
VTARLKYTCTACGTRLDLRRGSIVIMYPEDDSQSDGWKLQILCRPCFLAKEAATP